RVFNADGSEAEMCGNGIRCVARFARERLGALREVVRVETPRGILPVQLGLRRGRFVEATVDMGRPELSLTRIGVIKSRLKRSKPRPWHTVAIRDAELTGVFVSMGNPHFVAFF